MENQEFVVGGFLLTVVGSGSLLLWMSVLVTQIAMWLWSIIDRAEIKPNPLLNNKFTSSLTYPISTRVVGGETLYVVDYDCNCILIEYGECLEALYSPTDVELREYGFESKELAEEARKSWGRYDYKYNENIHTSVAFLPMLATLAAATLGCVIDVAPNLVLTVALTIGGVFLARWLRDTQKFAIKTIKALDEHKQDNKLHNSGE